MTDFLRYLTRKPKLPLPGNTVFAERGLERWEYTLANLPDTDTVATTLQDITSKHDVLRFLEAIWGNSPYLMQVLLRYPEWFLHMCAESLEGVYDHALVELRYSLKGLLDTNQLMQELRIAKQKISFLVAAADISGYWEVEEVTHRLSVFADLVIQSVLEHLLLKAHERGEIQLKNVENPCVGSGVTVIAMGKLGASELNYSSDVDLVMFYDEDVLEYTGSSTRSRFYIRLTQELARILQERTKDGYVFRTDLRLRPDPGSTPVAVSLDAAAHYYETLGQNWERAAMIKARPVAGDANVSEAFIKMIHPYVWRRSLDFHSIQDIHSIKRQIDNREGELDKRFYDYNIKLGHGGIREIEFFVQTQQLIFGGRRPVLQISGTCASLKALVEAEELEEEAYKELTDAYRFYRMVEHRLQMIDDHQTHTLPDSAEKMQEFSVFMGFATTEAFLTVLSSHIQNVRQRYAQLFEHSPSLASDHPHARGSLVFTGSDNDPETLQTLERMGFPEPTMISEAVRGWHHGRYRAMRTKRAREMLTELMPVLLSAFAESANPGVAFKRFDDFLEKLPAGVQIFSLFYSNPNLLHLIAEIMGGYPFIADTLSRSPELLDYVLAPEFYQQLPEKKDLQANLERYLQRAADFEDVLDIVRMWTHDRQFRIGIQLIKNTRSSAEAAVDLSNIADVALNMIFSHVEKDYIAKHGRIKNGHFAILALGKLGSRELTLGSDIDLIFVYDTPEDAVSDGEHPQEASRYYARLSRRFVNAVTALTRFGMLYHIDLRLRPSGEDGPVATSLKAFDQYFGSSAWVWEYMALTRTRIIVSADEDYRKQVRAIINDKLLQPWDDVALKEGMVMMHERVEQSSYVSDNAFNIKFVPGGLLNLEYIVQYWQLSHAHEHPKVLQFNTAKAIEACIKLEICDRKTGETLLEAWRLYHQLQSLFRLTGVEIPEKYGMSAGFTKTILQHLPYDTIDALEEALQDMQKKVQSLFKNVILS